MPKKLTCKPFFFFVAISSVAGFVFLARSSRSQDAREHLRPRTAHPFTPEESKALNAQANRSQNVEKQARLLFKQRRFTEAIQIAKRALDVSGKINGQPTNMQALQLLGDIYLEQKRYEDAIETYNRARQHTRNKELDINTALAYVRMSDLKSARKFYSENKFFVTDMPAKERVQYLGQLPGTKTAKSFEASLFYARGVEKDSYGANEEAAGDYKKALQLFPRNGLIAYQMAEKLMRLKRYDEALPMWARAARFGKGYNAKDAKNRMAAFPAAQRERAMRDVGKL